MKKILCSILFIAVLLVSCNKEDFGNNTAPVLEERTFVATQGDGLKTVTPDDIRIDWEAGDSIKLFANSSANYAGYKFITSEEGQVASFKGTVPSTAVLTYAMYPWNDNATALSNGFQFSIPDVQDGKFHNAVLAGVIDNTTRSVKFKAVTSVIKINVPAEDNVQMITVYSQQVLAGNVTANYNGNAWTATIGSADMDKINMVTVKAPKGGKLSGDVYITVLATASAPDLAFTFYNPTKHGKKAKTLTNKLVQNRITDLGVSEITFTRTNSAFTVNGAGDQVYFTIGNLQYQPSSMTWRIAGHGYDYVGGIDSKQYGTVFEDGVQCNNSKIDPAYTGWVDLFAYGLTGYKDEASGIDLNPCNGMWGDDYGSGALDENTDWGRFCTIQGTPEGQEHKMRVLTKEEWEYLATREPLRFKNKEPWYFTSRMGHAQIVDDNDYSKVITYGTVLLPEVFEDAWTSLIHEGKFLSRGEAGAGYEANKYTMDGWRAMEANGAIMLPACGYRGGAESFAWMPGDGWIGVYWTSSWNNQPYRFNLSHSHFDGPYTSAVQSGYAVRLVWDVVK